MCEANNRVPREDEFVASSRILKNLLASAFVDYFSSTPIPFGYTEVFNRSFKVRAVAGPLRGNEGSGLIVILEHSCFFVCFVMIDALKFVFPDFECHYETRTKTGEVFVH